MEVVCYRVETLACVQVYCYSVETLSQMQLSWRSVDTLSHMQVFCYSGVPAHEEMRQACFEYLKLGGIYSSGPISLLSGLAPKPSLLVMHFFMVALYGVSRLMRPRPTFK